MDVRQRGIEVHHDTDRDELESNLDSEDEGLCFIEEEETNDTDLVGDIDLADYGVEDAIDLADNEVEDAIDEDSSTVDDNAPCNLRCMKNIKE